jgi:hypothetical protein
MSPRVRTVGKVTFLTRFSVPLIPNTLVAKKLQRQGQQRCSFFGEHGRHLPLGLQHVPVQRIDRWIINVRREHAFAQVIQDTTRVDPPRRRNAFSCNSAQTCTLERNPITIGRIWVITEANLNAHAERWVRSIKDECLSKLILFGEKSLRRVVSQYLEHYHQERNHQGKDNLLLFPAPVPCQRAHRVAIRCRERLGGLLNYYSRAA